MSKRRRTARRQQRSINRVFESINTEYGSFVDPRDALMDPESGEEWLPVGMNGMEAWEREGAPTTEIELQTVRRRCRCLATTNGFAINGHENRISYVVGSGHTYSVEAKKDEEVSDEDIKAVQSIIDDFSRVNNWHQRQQEIVRRLDRDGEVFLRTFNDADGTIRVRFIEPSQVKCPESQTDPSNSFGVKTDPEDVETVLGYWVDGKFIDAAEIQHRKANVDCNVKRGLPTFWPVRKGLDRAERLLRNMAAKVEIVTALAMIRKHVGTSSTGVQAFVNGTATATITNQSTGETNYARRYSPGTILDAPSGTEYEYPSASLGVAEITVAVQAQLRAVASRLVMPEFMLSSDASNANYSSTMVAEGPAVKMFERLQWSMIEADTELIEKALRAAEAAGKLTTGLTDRIEVTATPPNVLSRNRADDTQADNTLVTAGAMSKQTMAERNDLDWSVEEERIDAEREKDIANQPPELKLFDDGSGKPPPPKVAADDEKPMEAAERIAAAHALLWEGYP